MNDVIELEGSPAQRGEKIGKLFAPHIERLVGRYRRFLFESTTQRGLKVLDDKACSRYVEQCLPHCREFAPDLIEEIEATARAADRSFEDLMLLNAFLDIIDQTHSSYPNWGCTSFADKRDGKLVVGQTYDLPNLFQDGSIFVRLRDPDGPDAIYYTVAGVVGAAGFNDHGISLVINNLQPADSRPGVLYPMVVRKVLASHHAAQAINAVLSPRRASGFFYLIGDKSGDAYPLETTASAYRLMPGTFPVTHANHYVHEAFLDQDRRHPSAFGHSIVRQKRLAVRLSEGDLSSLGMMSAMSDHVCQPVSVCQHALAPDDFACGKTVAAFSVDFEKLEMSAVIGNPCEGTPFTISFKDR